MLVKTCTHGPSLPASSDQSLVNGSIGIITLDLFGAVSDVLMRPRPCTIEALNASSKLFPVMVSNAYARMVKAALE
jgi:hypothetical protein